MKRTICYFLDLGNCWASCSRSLIPCTLPFSLFKTLKLLFHFSLVFFCFYKLESWFWWKRKFPEIFWCLSLSLEKIIDTSVQTLIQQIQTVFFFSFHNSAFVRSQYPNKNEKKIYNNESILNIKSLNQEYFALGGRQIEPGHFPAHHAWLNFIFYCFWWRKLVPVPLSSILSKITNISITLYI